MRHSSAGGSSRKLLLFQALPPRLPAKDASKDAWNGSSEVYGVDSGPVWGVVHKRGPARCQEAQHGCFLGKSDGCDSHEGKLEAGGCRCNLEYVPYTVSR